MFKKRRVRALIFDIFAEAGFVRSDRPFPHNMSYLCHYVYETGVDKWWRIISRQPASIEAYACEIIKFTMEGCSPEKYLAAMEKEGKYKPIDIVDKDLLKEIKELNDLSTAQFGPTTGEYEGDLEATHGALLVAMNRYK